MEAKHLDDFEEDFQNIYIHIRYIKIKEILFLVQMDVRVLLKIILHRLDWNI